MSRIRTRSASANGSATESWADRAAEFAVKLVSECLHPVVHEELRRAEPRLPTLLLASGLLVASTVFLMQAGREALAASGAPPWLSALTMALAGLASGLAILYRHAHKE